MDQMAHETSEKTAHETAETVVAGAKPMPEVLLEALKTRGYADLMCNRIVVDDMTPDKSTEGEKAFLALVKDVLSMSPDIASIHSVKEFPGKPLTMVEAMKLRTGFLAINGIKLLRSAGLNVGPQYIDHVQFPLWRSQLWTCPKAEKGVTFLGITRPEDPSAMHPFDFARSSRYNNCVLIRETRDPEVHRGEDYIAHHDVGLIGLAEMVTLSFIEIDSNRKTFRYYCPQGCSRLYSWDELEHDAKVQAAVISKLIVKGRVPRTKDFTLRLREGWDPAHAAFVEAAQARIKAAMPLLAPLFSIKKSFTDLLPHMVMDIGVLSLAQFMDGRNGMSYGFLAYQLPLRGPVEECTSVSVLCTRSGCNKQDCHPDRDWVVLRIDLEDMTVEVTESMKDITSPSFDSWLILAQAVANVGLARSFKAAGRCRQYVRRVEDEGLAIAHFHGFVDRKSLPPNVAFFGQDALPLPCGSVDVAGLTCREKASIGTKVLAADVDVEYLGDVHVEPDHGSVVSCDFETLEELIKPEASGYGLSYFNSYKLQEPREDPFEHWDPSSAVAAAGGKGL